MQTWVLQLGKNLHNFCSLFILGILVVPREVKTVIMQNFFLISPNSPFLYGGRGLLLFHNDLRQPFSCFLLRKHVHNNSQSGNVFFIITKLLCGAIFKFKILLQSFRSGKKMRKYTAYQTILYSRSMYLFPKQVHRTICVNLTAKCEQKSRYFLCLFDETDYCSDSCSRVKGR